MPFARAVEGAVVRKDTAAGDALLTEPALGTGQEYDRGGLLLVRQLLPVRQAGGVIDCHVDLLVTGTTGAALTAIAGDPVDAPLKQGRLLLLRRSLRVGIDVWHVP